MKYKCRELLSISPQLHDEQNLIAYSCDNLLIWRTFSLWKQNHNKCRNAKISLTFIMKQILRKIDFKSTHFVTDQRYSTIPWIFSLTRESTYFFIRNLKRMRILDSWFYYSDYEFATKRNRRDFLFVRVVFLGNHCDLNHVTNTA